MTERWQERRVENELLKRELLLRLRAEHSAVPGRGEPATDDFRRRVRRLLLRHPIFALKLYLLLIDVGLGRVDAAKRAAHLHTGTSSRGRHRPRDLGVVSRRSPAVGHLGRELRRQRLRWKPRLVHGLRICASAGAASIAGLRRLALLWFARLGEGLRVCESFAAGLAAELRRAGGLLVARLVGGLRALASWVAVLGVEGRRARLAIGAGGVRVALAMFASLMRAGRRQRLLIHVRLLRLRQTGGSTFAGLMIGLRRQRLVLRGHLLRAALTGGSAVAGLMVAGRRHWPSLRVGLARIARECESALIRLLAAGRRQRLLLHARLIRLRRTCGVMLVRVVTLLRQQRPGLRAHLIRAKLVGLSVLDGLSAASVRRRRWWGEHVFRMKRACRSFGPHARYAIAREPASPPRKSDLGLRSVRRSRIESTGTRAPARKRFPRVTGALIAGIALTAAAAIAVVATRNVGSSGQPESLGAGNARSADQIAPGLLHFPDAPTRNAGAHASPRPVKHVERTPARTARRAKQKVAQRLTLVANTVETASVPAAPATSTAATASHGTGPGPLPAPPGASGPGPLKAPQG